MSLSESPLTAASTLEVRLHESKPSATQLIFSRLRRITGGREVWALADQAVVSGTNFITNIVLARTLGIKGFGVFALAWMAVLFLNNLQSAIVVAPMMSVGPKTPEQNRPSYFGATAVHQLCFATLCGLAIWLATYVSSIYFHDLTIRQLAFPLSVAAFAYLSQDFFRRYLFVTGQTGRAFTNDLLSYLPQVLGLILLAWLGHLTTARAFWIIALTSCFGIVAGLLWLERITISTSAIRTVASQHWKLSRWLAPSAIMEWMSNNLFVAVSPIYFGVTVAGILRAASNIVGGAHIWFLGLDNVVPAEASRTLHREGIDAMLGYVKRVLWRWGAVTTLFVLIVGAVPSFWLHLLYGPQYAAYGYLLRIYGLLYLLVFLGGPLRAALQALEFTKPIFWSYTVMTVFSFIFAAPFSKWFGVQGVIFGSIATQIIYQSILTGSLVARVRHVRRQVTKDRAELLAD
jgi:O-antigen/teichoic acid export membrane protein